MASLEDIVAMKLHVMGDGGRKKDFWDLNELQSKIHTKSNVRFV